ncbi:MAG: ABC transporter permease [Gammaproteobacteria bacterium]|jgi:sodium transport system permease protein|nr:ABC transporter permease [Gammaproteobacteria bacterium]
MGQIFTVFRKEVTDNLRDRRTLMSALLFGPLFGPLLFAGMISLTLERSIGESVEALRLPVSGVDNAPSLVQFLKQNNVDIVGLSLTMEQARELIDAGTEDVVLIVPDGYGEALRAGKPAVVQLVSDNANSNATKSIRRAERLLRAYERQLGALRLLARGVNPSLINPIAVEDVDVSTPTGRSIILLGMMNYFIIFSMLMGGLYLATDTTAGERERGSLEPLLTLPVERWRLIVGKVLATCLFMVLSLAISLLAFSLSLSFVPLAEVGMASNFGPAVAARIFLVMLPFALVGAAGMTAVASFTKSYKEAQTYLQVLMLVPTLPIIVAALFTLKPTLPLMLVPSLSQHLVITGLMKADPLAMVFVVVSFTSTLVIGLLLLGLAARLYRREGILG